MQKSEHTRTPWHFKTHAGTGDCGFKAEGTGVFAEFFADIRYVGEDNRAEALANAEFVIRAVNTYDALVAALEECAEYFDNHSDLYSEDGEMVANKELRLFAVCDEVLKAAGRAAHAQP